MYVSHHDGDIGNHGCNLLDIVTWHSGTSSTALANNRGTVTDNLHSVHCHIAFLERVIMVSHGMRP